MKWDMSVALIMSAILAWLAQVSAFRQPNDECLRFLALGDWGTPLVKTTAEFMANEISKPSSTGCTSRPEAVFMLGDNFYESGIRSPSDEKFKRYFTANFEIPAFDNVSFCAIAGNHDHHGFVSAQIAATGPHWYFPSLYYSRVFTKGGLRVLVAFLDTWQLVGGEAWDDPGHIVDTKQKEWLKQVLQDDQVDFKIVVGHYPIRSVRADTRGLVKGLIPILEEGKVDFYLHGHDHITQIIKRDGLTYVGSGIGGGRDAHGPIPSKPGLVWSSSHNLGFLDISISKSSLVIDFHEIQGGSCLVAYSFEVTKREADDTTAALIAVLKNRLVNDW